MLIILALVFLGILSSITVAKIQRVQPSNEKYSTQFVGYDGTWYDENNFAVIVIKEDKKMAF